VVFLGRRTLGGRHDKRASSTAHNSQSCLPTPTAPG
jgi:hypothetical protein